MHEKCLAHSAMPDGQAELRISPDGVLRLWSLFKRETDSWTGSFSGTYGTNGTGGRSRRANHLHSRSLMPSGTAFAINIIRRACTSCGVKMMSFLKEEHGGSLKKRWSLVLEKGTPETHSLVSRWVRAHVGASAISWPLNKSLVAVGRNFWHDVN